MRNVLYVRGIIVSDRKSILDRGDLVSALISFQLLKNMSQFSTARSVGEDTNKKTIFDDGYNAQRSIINQSVVYLPVKKRSEFNLPDIGQLLTQQGGQERGECSPSTTSTHTCDTVTEYQKVVDNNNVDHSVVTGSDSAAYCLSHEQCPVVHLPRTIQPRQFDNLVLVSLGKFHISLGDASGMAFEGTCFCASDVIDTSPPESNFIFLSLNKKDTLYVCVAETQLILDSSDNPRAQRYRKPKDILLRGTRWNVDTPDAIQAVNSIRKHEPPLWKPLGQRTLQDIKQQDLYPSDVIKEKQECSAQGTLAEKALYTSVIRERNDSFIFQSQYLTEEQPRDLVQITCTSRPYSTADKNDEYKPSSRGNHRPGKSVPPQMYRAQEDEKTKATGVQRTSGRNQSSDSKVDAKQNHKSRKSPMTLIPPSEQRNACQTTKTCPSVAPHGGRKVKPTCKANLSYSQEETQFGSCSSIGFSTDFSYVRLLAEAFTQNGREPVIGLLRKDLMSGEFLSHERRSVSSRTTQITSVNRDAEEQTRDRQPAVRISILPDIFKEITPQLHASDYPKVIQLLGDIDNLPPEHHIPALFIAGVAYFKMSKYDESKTHFFRCESLAIGENREGDVMLCNAYLGDIEYASQSYLKAAKHYKYSIKYYSPGSVALLFKLTPPSLSAIYAKQASSFRNDSKMIDAVHNYKMAIDVAQMDRDRLSAHTSLGNLYQSMGENSSALEQYKQSIELATVLSDLVSLGWAHGNIGNAYLGLNKKDEALHHLQKSLELAVKYECTPQAIGRTYNNLGTAYQSMNDLDKAEEYYDLALSQAVYGNDIPGQARVYGNIGNVHMLRKNYERAIPHYGEVLNLSTDPSTVSTAQHNRGCAYYEWATSLCDRVLQLSLHGPGCDVDSCLANIPAKAKELYSKGVKDLEEVVKYHEKRLHDVKGSTKGLTLSVSLIESNSRTFHRLQDCLVNLHRWEEALVVAEKSRARTLGELMLKRKGSCLQEAIMSPLTFDQIAGIIENQRCPVIYLSYTGARLIGWVFVWSSGKVSLNTFVVPLADDQFEGKAFDYHLRYSLTEKLVEHSFEMYQTISYNEETSSTVQVLYDLVAMPVSTFLCKLQSTPVAQQIICISDSYTCLLPLTCLLDRKTGSFFGDRFYFKLAPSLLSLGIMSQLPEVTINLHGDQYDFCVIGDPNIPPFILNGEVWTLGKLPHAGREADWVAYALKTTPIKGEHASKTALLNRSMNAKVIHIATHGSASAGFLAFSTFFTSAKSGSFKHVTAENVLLYPQDVEGLTISPALVVLSSCDSGRGTVKADGIQGMARAFILAGAQSVLTTLWKVPDESASVFMQFFYQYLLDEMPSSYALHKAILSVRCFAKYSQYIHWSGYQLTGQDIRFCKNETTSNNILGKRLGNASVFPRLQDIKKLEKVLVKNPNLPTDVQVSVYIYGWMC